MQTEAGGGSSCERVKTASREEFKQLLSWCDGGRDFIRDDFSCFPDSSLVNKAAAARQVRARASYCGMVRICVTAVDPKSSRDSCGIICGGENRVEGKLIIYLFFIFWGWSRSLIQI